VLFQANSTKYLPVVFGITSDAVKVLGEALIVTENK
jgi:hypothetical protein